jgi:hypothetical protein
MALGINIVSAFDGRGLEKAVKEFNKLETTGQRAQFAIQKAALPAAAALAGLGFAAVKATQAAMQETQEMTVLASTLRQVTGASQATIDANEDFLSSMQRATIYSDSDLRPALASLVQGSGDLARSQQDLQLAMDIATATGIPLVQVADSLSKAYNGNFKSLKALSPALNDNIKEGQSLDAIFQELSNTFSGSTAAATDTAAGKMKQLQNQVADLQESIGMTLLPIVEKIVPIFASLASAISNNQTTFLVIVGAIAAFSAAIIAASAVIKVHTTYQKLMGIEVVKNSAIFKGATTAAVGFGGALGTLMVAQALAPLINNLTGATGRADEAFKKTAASVDAFAKNAGSAEQVLRDFINTAQKDLQKFDPIGTIGDVATFENFGREFKLLADGVKLDIEAMDETFKRFASESPEVAGQIVNAMKAQLAVTDPTSRAYKDLQAAIARYEGQVRTATAAQNALNGVIANTPRVIPLTGALARLEAQTQREFIARQTSSNALQEWNDKAKETYSGAQKAAAATQTAKEKLEEFTGALRTNYDAQRSLSSAERNRVSANNALKAAIDSTAKAQTYFNNVSKGFPRDSKEAIDATERYADANRRLRDSNIRLREATENQTNAEKELIRLRQITANAEDVADAERNLERSKYRVEEANFAVTDAEAKLAELRADPKASAIDIRRAEIDLAEAKLAVKDSVRAVKEAEQELNNQVNRKATAEEIAEAERDLQKAKMQVVDATEEVENATANEIKAQEVLNEILHGAKEGTDAYREALDELTRAKETEEGARLAVAEAILAEATATLSLAKAVDELNAVQAKTPAGMVRRGQERLAGVSTSNPALGILNSGGGQGNTTNFNMTVNAGMGTDADQVAREIIDVLKSYERANGVIPLITEYQVAV